MPECPPDYNGLPKPAPISTIRTISTVLRFEIENMFFEDDLVRYSSEKEKNRHAMLLLIPGNSSLFLF